MKIQNYLLQLDGDIRLSKSFINELNKQLTRILCSNIGGIIDTKSTYLNFNKMPVNNPADSTTYWNITLFYIPPFAFEYIVYWKNIKQNTHISWTDKVEKGSILFWIEGLDVSEVINHIQTYSYLQKKVFLEGYRFVVELKNLDINITFKILYGEIIPEPILIKIERLMGNSISEYNENNQKQVEGFEGLIHSISLKQHKKDYVLFKIDLGTAVDIGLKFLLKKLDQSDLLITKIVVKTV